mgnify:CR=1 FL=1
MLNYSLHTFYSIYMGSGLTLKRLQLKPSKQIMSGLLPSLSLCCVWVCFPGCVYNNSILAYLLLIISREVFIKLSTILVINNKLWKDFQFLYMLFVNFFLVYLTRTVLLYLYLTTVLLTTHKLNLESNKS